MYKCKYTHMHTLAYFVKRNTENVKKYIKTWPKESGWKQSVGIWIGVTLRIISLFDTDFWTIRIFYVVKKLRCKWKNSSKL